MIGSVNWWI